MTASPDFKTVLADISVLEAEMKRRQAKSDWTVWCPHKPFPKQQEFLSLTCLEAMYGGAAGGGKSDAALMAALQYVHVPEYTALVLRRTYADLALPGAIMDRAKSWWIPMGVHWDETAKTFTFPSGARITFGYLDSKQDHYRYQGSNFHFVAFDELTQFPEDQYRYLFSRMRRLGDSAVPIRMRATSNPGGIGHHWVRKRFIEGSTRQAGAVFVPATRHDNLALDVAEYDKALEHLSPVTRMQLMDGVWVDDSSGLVYAHFDERKCLVDKAPKELTYHLLGIDYGFIDSTAFAVLGWRDNDPTVYCLEAYKMPRITPSDAAEETRRLESKYHFVKIVGDTGGLGKGYAEEARQRFTLPIEAAEKHNKRGYIDLINGDLDRGRLKLVAERTTQLVEEWQALPWDRLRKKPAEGFEDHIADAILYGWRACRAYHEVVPEAEPEAGTDAYWHKQEQALTERMEQEWEKRQKEEWWER